MRNEDEFIHPVVCNAILNYSTHDIEWRGENNNDNA